MIVNLVACHILTGCFMFAVVGPQRLPKWVSLPYLYFLGLGLCLAAFSMTNAILSGRAHDVESRGWFSTYATISGGAALVLLLGAGIFAVVVQRRLSTRRLIIGCASLFLVSLCVMLALSEFPQLNWW
ncbi:MAG: hypothetical protein NTW19_21730 [Planctomycetota bacterium]|nr:hypothetical protein [Planctomycetota bacterium]